MVRLPTTVKLPCATVVAATAPKLVNPAKVVTLGRYAAVLALAPVARLVILIACVAALLNSVVMFVVAVPKLALIVLILVACVAALLNKVVTLVVAVPKLASSVAIAVACVAALLNSVVMFVVAVPKLALA